MDVPSWMFLSGQDAASNAHARQSAASCRKFHGPRLANGHRMHWNHDHVPGIAPHGRAPSHPADSCAQFIPASPAPLLPIPTGTTARPNVDYSNSATRLDSMKMHSSINLQGYATKEKFAPCLFCNLTEKDISAQLGGFESALVINNPSPTIAANVRVELRDRSEDLVATLSAPALPNDTWTRSVPELQTLANGVGSARIVSDQPIVGASLH